MVYKERIDMSAISERQAKDLKVRLGPLYDSLVIFPVNENSRKIVIHIELQIRLKAMMGEISTITADTNNQLSESMKAILNDDQSNDGTELPDNNKTGVQPIGEFHKRRWELFQYIGALIFKEILTVEDVHCLQHLATQMFMMNEIFIQQNPHSSRS